MVKGSQLIQAHKAWVESENMNVQQILCDLFDLVQKMNIRVASYSWNNATAQKNGDINSTAAFAYYLGAKLE